MKKAIVTLLAAGAMLFCGAFAAQAQPGGGFGGQMDPEQFATRRADQMKESLKLTDQQYKDVVAYFKEQMAEMQKRFEGGQGGGGGFDMEEMQKMRQAQEAKLKAILTEEQFKKWTTEQQNRRGQGGPGGGGFGGGRP